MSSSTPPTRPTRPLVAPAAPGLPPAKYFRQKGRKTKKFFTKYNGQRQVEYFLAHFKPPGGGTLSHKLVGLMINGVQCVLDEPTMNAYKKFLDLWGSTGGPGLIHKKYDTLRSSSGTGSAHIYGKGLDLGFINKNHKEKYIKNKNYRMAFIRKFIGAGQKAGFKRFAWSCNGTSFHLDTMDSPAKRWWLYAPSGVRYVSHPADGIAYPKVGSGPVYESNRRKIRDQITSEASKAWGKILSSRPAPAASAGPAAMASWVADQAKAGALETGSATARQKRDARDKLAKKHSKKYAAIRKKAYRDIFGKLRVHFILGHDLVDYYPPELKAIRVLDMTSHASISLP